MTRLESWARRPVSWLAVVILGCLLAAPCLTVGFTSDDHVHRVKQDPASELGGFAYDPWSLFEFISGDPEARRAGMESGVLSWWTADGLQLAFNRPLSTLTHRLDHALWPDSAPLAYAHSLAWFALLLVCLAMLYRRLHTPGVALLALAVFALDDAHGPTLGFIANRNSVIAAVFAVLCLWAHDRARRDGWRPGLVLGPVALGLSLLAAEAGVTTLGYLVAYALTVDPGAWRERFKSAAPYAVVFGLWSVAYKLGGYGAHLSGVYIDPGGEPGRFAVALAERAVPLLGAQVGLIWSDFWVIFPAGLKAAVWAISAGFVAAMVALLAPMLRTSEALRFWLIGAVLSVVPIAATVPADRLLMLVGLGAMPLVAALVVAGLRPAAALPVWRRWGLRGMAFTLVGVHLIASPLLLPLRARSMETIQRSMALIDAAAPPTAESAGTTLVVVSAPGDGFVSYLPIRRASQGLPGPARVRLLSTTMGETLVTRTGPRSLRVRPEEGLLSTEAERILRSDSTPFAVGDTVTLSDMTVRVVELRSWWPQEIEVTFERDLDDPNMRWIVWTGAAFEPWEVPAVGATATLAATDMAATFTAITQDAPAAATE